MRRNKQIGMIHMPWWCRDQNFRKYFEMRKKNGIRPALKGFANDEHYRNYIQKSTHKFKIQEEYLRHGDPHRIEF